MGKYVIEDIRCIIINGKEYPWTPCEIEMTQEEIRGGLGTYNPKYKTIENVDKKEIIREDETI
jgi:hypothetical protein